MLTDAEIAARYVKIRPYLDERQRRLWLGVEAQALGSGGVAVIARATGADVKTVRRGTAEIESGAEPGGRVRGPGGGRPGLAELDAGRSEEHTSELQSQSNLVCRLLLEKKKKMCSGWTVKKKYSRSRRMSSRDCTR